MTAATLDLVTPAHRAPTLAVAAGRNLIAAGAIFGLANLVQWSILGGVLPLHPALLSVTWPIAVTLFIVILRRLRNAGGPAAVRAAGWSRGAILLQIGAALTLAGASALTQDWSLMMWMSPIGLGFYAVAWLIAAMRGGAPWMTAVGVGAAAAAGGVALLVGTPVQYLAYGMGLIVFALVPGLVLATGRGR
ncbi:hypothetical protein [Brevundimonas subvibrioides]|uniref:Uncharacterized protein n=1 Tax=Brevundimonas subvibrioides (strain ATCC 15264 / DSM 4735 / LMG 14903 / NBRC 16000 / CB 81) TaxID=633149 RepID=D9QLB2_BRESC|nr:hypothetical protein [Brevundimonas subvibrioides]ADK99967.1 hypothetical protein Bresu_0653 [Brevundimonas subvibrioides ATCC 15264]